MTTLRYTHHYHAVTKPLSLTALHEQLDSSKWVQCVHGLALMPNALITRFFSSTRRDRTFGQPSSIHVAYRATSGDSPSTSAGGV